ncbi:MAG: alpha/beta hydrolase [Bdellovibrionales bacterium]|nr:alpha/beta hydrolase [Bdellovibrionales bacterium]
MANINNPDMKNPEEPLPYSGFRRRASLKKYEEVIIFVHQFGGSPIALARHLLLANEMGFDAVAFQLKFNRIRLMQFPPLTRNYRFGAPEVWAEQISDILASIPERKVLFTLSSPGSGALLSIARRNPQDVVGWICDGGPFAQIQRCLWNLFTHEYTITNPVSRIVKASFAVQLLGGRRYKKTCDDALAQLPPRFPILSIRAWKDKLVPMQAIEEFFAGANHLHLEVFSIPEVGHLQGLSRSPKEYKLRVEKFLHGIATPTNRAKSESTGPRESSQ